MGHSLFSPSAAHRWIPCPASIAACLDYPETTSVYADEGTKAHDLSAQVLKDPNYTPDCDDEMRTAIETYTTTVNAMAEGATLRLVEQELDTSEVIGVPEQNGTGDFIAVVSTCLQVHDLKYGKGVKVEAQDNKQLIIYALAVLGLVEMIVEEPIDKVQLVIHQPRLGSVSEAFYTVDELRAFLPEIQAAAKAHMEGTAQFNPGEKQCRFCDHKIYCEALQKHAMHVLIDDFEDLTTAEELKTQLKTVNAAGVPKSVDRLSVIMQNAGLIESLLKAVEAEVYRLLTDGQDVPGFKLVEGRAGARQWVDEVKAEEIMKSMRLKVDEMYKMSLISPTVAEKLLKDSPRKWNRLVDQITRNDGKPTIADINDKRPALQVKPVEESFDDLTGDDLI